MAYAAAYLSVFMLIGHLIFGIKWYVKPILDSNADAVPRTVMHAVFHYMTVVMLVSAGALVIYAHDLMAVSPQVALFIGLIYLLCGIAQIVLVLAAAGPKGLVAMFQWTMFLPIGVLAILAARL
ncbi:hypothetical protein FJZ36_19190 [Candidatus Poribacteria bacterium]|nr:hypothetical protein [Candidatus Poribacteria bacterium]